MRWLELLALVELPDDRKRSALALWMMTLLLGVILILVCAWLLSRWRRRLTQERKLRPERVILDAWAEAGRRAEPITVDLDPPPDGPDSEEPPRNSERPEQPE